MNRGMQRLTAICSANGTIDAPITTKSGTIIVDGVEYNIYPPPNALVKATKRCWAEQFVAAGAMRFRHLDYYRQWENPALGDPTDGKGLFHMGGHPYTFGSGNEVYAWCSSLTEITPSRINSMALNSGYDCLVRISEPATLIQRANTASLATGLTLLLHCAEVSYDRGNEVDKKTLNSQKSKFNVFQKALRSAEDKEYRLAFTDVSLKSIHRDYVDLQIGDCSDILSIEDLPPTACCENASVTRELRDKTNEND